MGDEEQRPDSSRRLLQFQFVKQVAEIIMQLLLEVTSFNIFNQEGGAPALRIQ